MRDFCLNVLIAVASLIGAVVVAGSVQAAFQYALPAFSGRIVGSTDVATYVFVALLGASFFLVGARVSRWLRTSTPLVWLLFPVVAVYLIAIFGQPGAYRCNPLNTSYVVNCSLVLSPFWVSAAALVVGYVLVGKVRSFKRAA